MHVESKIERNEDGHAGERARPGSKSSLSGEKMWDRSKFDIDVVLMTTRPTLSGE